MHYHLAVAQKYKQRRGVHGLFEGGKRVSGQRFCLGASKKGGAWNTFQMLAPRTLNARFKARVSARGNPG